MKMGNTAKRQPYPLGTPARVRLLSLLLFSLLIPRLEADTERTRYAKSLSVRDHGDYTVVTISDAWEGARRLRYLLIERGAERDAGRPEGEFDGVIEVPLERIASLATPAIAHLADLDALETVVAVDNGEYIYNERLRRRLTDGTVPEVGSGSSFNLERLLLMRPQLVVLSIMGPDDPTAKRLDSVGIPVLPLADWREQSPLGRAEWVTLFGSLLGKETEAEELFEPRASRYLEIAELTAGEVTGDRPEVLTNAPWQGSWPVPAGDSYVARLFAAAGGEYLWAERGGTGSLFLDLEVVLRRGADADVWINLNHGWKSRDDALATDPRLASFRAFRTNEMYHHNRRLRPSGANDFWESGATRPDLVLSDIVRILHPALLPDHELVYYKRLKP